MILMRILNYNFGVHLELLASQYEYECFLVLQGAILKS